MTATATRSGDRLRMACECLPGGVDLCLTVYAERLAARGGFDRADWLSRWHHLGRAGETYTCPVCDRAWALSGRWDGRGELVLVHVPRLEPGTTLPAELALAAAIGLQAAVRA